MGRRYEIVVEHVDGSETRHEIVVEVGSLFRVLDDMYGERKGIARVCARYLEEVDNA